MGLLTFKGGLHPYDGKELSKDKAITEYLPQGEMVYPLSQHIGAPAVACVKKGDNVLVGQKIAEAGMEDHVIMLGKKENPYPYIKACDIYVQPSRYEGKSITVREAQILCKPVIITNYATAHSQVKDGIDGLIVPMDNEGCAMGILSLINDKDLQLSMTAYLHSHNYGNEQEVNKIYDLI